MTSTSPQEICRRIAEIRLRVFGPRGKASFAKAVGISSSTYNYYERDRVPPVDVLAKIASLSGVNLCWLLMGQDLHPNLHFNHAAVANIAQLLTDHPEASGPLSAFVELLSTSFNWTEPSQDVPSSAAIAASLQSVLQGKTPSLAMPPVAAPAKAAPGAAAGGATEDWIPVLGRSAAGVTHFWDDADKAKGVTLLSDLVRRHARKASRQVSQAESETSLVGAAGPVQVITLRQPDEDNVAEFISAGVIKRRYNDAFALRIDGDSMSPEIRHGEIVICSPSAPAADAQAAVVQLAGQIGVTCKIFRRQGNEVHLMPINEQYPTAIFPAANVVWSARVLARVRTSQRREQ